MRLESSGNMAKVVTGLVLIVASRMLIAPATADDQTVGIRASLRPTIQNTTRTDYLLDNGGGYLALYPSAGYRGLVDPKYRAQSLEDLKSRVSGLPKGARIFWSPYNLDSLGKPFLFKQGQFDEFQAFCRAHAVELKVGDVETTPSLVARLKEI